MILLKPNNSCLKSTICLKTVLITTSIDLRGRAKRKRPIKQVADFIKCRVDSSGLVVPHHPYLLGIIPQFCLGLFKRKLIGRLQPLGPTRLIFILEFGLQIPLVKQQQVGISNPLLGLITRVYTILIFTSLNKPDH